MAIDTAAKRFSIMNFGFTPHLLVLMPPDGTIGQGDKQHFLDLYSGITFAGAAPEASIGRSRVIYGGRSGQSR